MSQQCGDDGGGGRLGGELVHQLTQMKAHDTENTGPP